MSEVGLDGKELASMVLWPTHMGQSSRSAMALGEGGGRGAGRYGTNSSLDFAALSLHRLYIYATALVFFYALGVSLIILYDL